MIRMVARAALRAGLLGVVSLGSVPAVAAADLVTNVPSNGSGQVQRPETVRYVHADPLGSPVAYSDVGGSVTKRVAYEPYGAAVGSENGDGPGFTGHLRDSRTGLVYMQQRYQDPGLGVFLSVDPVSAVADPGALFNRYKYANNNPYRYRDPDGRCTGTKICNRDGTAKSTGEYTTMASTALRPQTVTSSMVSSSGPNQASQEQVNTAVSDANAVGRTAKAAGDSRAITAFNKLDAVVIDSSDWGVGTAMGTSIPYSTIAYALYDSNTDRGSVVLGAARYFDGRGEYYRVFRFMHEIFHFDSAFNDMRVQQLSAGCVAWECRYERAVEVAASEAMNGGWLKRDEVN